MKRPFKGLHIVRKRLATGEIETYHYAWRGGPRLKAEYGSQAFHAAFVAAYNQKRDTGKGTFEEAIMQYLTSQKFQDLAPRTQTEYRSLIDIIRAKFGSAKLSFFND